MNYTLNNNEENYLKEAAKNQYYIGYKQRKNTRTKTKNIYKK